jgi:hypothetical protein
MNVSKMIADLRAERDAVDQAITALTQLAGTQRRRRGRPPAWLAPADNSRTKRVFSAATRKKMALSQRRRWAAARKAKKD